jgi:uncharacterized protein YjbJ (UPF0337 family)
MSNAKNRIEGKAEEVSGKIKAGIGKLVGNEQMQAEGNAKAVKGEARQEAAKVGERAEGAVEEVKGAIKNRVGHVVDNEKWQAEGKAEELKGAARQKLNN